jgi:ribosome maturation factor RimP
MTTKKWLTLLAISAFIATTSSVALAKSFTGNVTKVDGSSITIELAKKDAKKITVGDSAKLSIKKANAPVAGSSALTGC